MFSPARIGKQVTHRMLPSATPVIANGDVLFDGCMCITKQRWASYAIKAGSPRAAVLRASLSRSSQPRRLPRCNVTPRPLARLHRGAVPWTPGFWVAKCLTRSTREELRPHVSSAYGGPTSGVCHARALQNSSLLQMRWRFKTRLRGEPQSSPAHLHESSRNQGVSLQQAWDLLAEPYMPLQAQPSARAVSERRAHQGA